MIAQLDAGKLQPTKTSVEATLNGNTFDGHQVQGTGKLKVVRVPLVDGAFEVVSEGHWKLLNTKYTESTKD